ncbi:hypothetical protein [Pseudomonas sp. Marseille-Q8238]
MLRSILIAPLMLLAASFTFAGLDYIPDVTQEKFEATNGVINHLIPSSVTNGHTYYLAEFTAYNSFLNSWAWRIYKNDKSATYILRSWEIHKSQDRKTKTEENVLEREVTEDLAQKIYTLWTNSILDSKYTLVMYRGLDGATYNFSTYLRSIGWIAGETWSPSEELPPRWLVEIGINIYEESRKDTATPLKVTDSINELSSKLSLYKSSNSRL